MEERESVQLSVRDQAKKDDNERMAIGKPNLTASRRFMQACRMSGSWAGV